METGTLHLKTFRRFRRKEEQDDSESDIKGLLPDPSIVRVGEDYYLVNSTFEWWPGVRLWAFQRSGELGTAPITFEPGISAGHAG